MKRSLVISLPLLALACAGRGTIIQAAPAAPRQVALPLDTLPNCTTQYDCYVNPTGDVCPDHTYGYGVRTLGTVVVRDSGMLIKSDGQGPYVTGRDNVYSHMRFWAALWTNQLSQGGRHSTRSLVFDLRHPVAEGGGIPLGVVNDRHGEFHALLKAEGKANRNLSDIPVGVTMLAEEADFGIYVNGVIHNLSMGPLGKGAECRPGETLIHGHGTTQVSISRPNLTTWIVDAPPNSIGRLWDIHNTDLYAIDRGLYFVSFHFEFTAQQPGVYLPVVEAARQGGADSALSLYQRLKTTARGEWRFGEGQLEIVSTWFAAHSRPQDALRILKANAAEYADNPDAQSSLAEGYVASGDTVDAVASFRRALAIDSRNQDVRAALRRLGAQPH